MATSNGLNGYIFVYIYLVASLFRTSHVWAHECKHEGSCISPPKVCSNEGSRFRKGDRYEFSYEVMTSTGLTRDPHGTAGTKLTCNLVISVLRKCELTMELLNCHLDDRGPSRFYTTTENSETLAEELSRHQVYFHYNEGMVIGHEIYVSELEPLYILNIKRGIVSLLQLPTKPDDLENKSVELHDIFGTCLTDVTFPENTATYVQTYRDLVACNLSHISESQANVLSYSKTLIGGYRMAPITEFSYPFESEVTCDFELGKHNILKLARCVQRQAHIPLGYEDQHFHSVVTNISQVIKFLSKTRLGNRPVDHSLNGKRLVKLTMEYESSDKKHSSDDLERELDVVLQDFIAQGHSNKINLDHSAQSYRRLVHTLRDMEEDEIRKVKDAIFACRHSTLCYKAFNEKLDYKTLQSTKEGLLISSLMSCGSRDCMIFVAESLKLKHIERLEADRILLNLGLFYHPSSRFVKHIFDYCKHDYSSECLLAMSAMMSRLNDSLESTSHKQVVGYIVFDVLTYLHKLIKENGKPLIENRLNHRDKLIKEETLLTAIKCVGNIGMYADKYYDSVLEKDLKITKYLLSLVKNQNISVSVARASVQALAAVGLKDAMINELLTVLKEERPPIVLRAAIFDEILIKGNETVMMKLVKLLEETSIENLQTYIVTKVSSLNEGLHLNHEEWRHKLTKLVEGLQIDQEENIWSKSQFSQFSHTVVIPLTSLRLGGQLALNILYTPTSSLFHSFTIKGTLEIGEEVWSVFDIVVDIEGMDDIVHLLRSNNKNKTDKSNFIQEIMSLIQQKFREAGKSSTFHFKHFSKTITQAIISIITSSNLQVTTLPKAYIFLKLNGYDVGWVSLNSFLTTLSHMKTSDSLVTTLIKTVTKICNTFLPQAVQLFDFHMTLPTIAGYPLNTNLEAAFVAKSGLQIKHSPAINKLSLNLAFHPSITTHFQGGMQVSFGGYSRSKITSKISGFATLDLSTNIEYSTADTVAERELFLNLVWNIGSEQFKFFNFKTDLFLLHNDIEHKVSPPETEKKFFKCLPDIYNLITGRRFCFHGSYFDVSKSGFYNFMNSFRITGTSDSEDEGLNQYTVNGSWSSNLQGPPEHQFRIQMSGLGSELSRILNITVNVDHHFGFKLQCFIPDANIVYVLQRKKVVNSTHHHIVYASVLQQESKTLYTLLFESKGHRIPKIGILPGNIILPYNHTDNVIHFSFALPSLSLDLRYKDRIHSATYATKDFIVKYFCEPKLKFLYAFHPVIRQAVSHGHTSTFSYHQEIMDSKTPLDKIWKAFYKFVIIWPEQKIVTTTEMVANMFSADRVSHLTWKYGNEVDEIHMTSHVTNKTTSHYQLFDYTLSLNNSGKFAVGLVGHFLIKGAKPFVNVTIRTDVKYVKTGMCEMKIKKTKSSCHSSDSKEKPLSIYDVIQVNMIRWLRGCDRAFELNNCQKWLEKERFLQWWKGCELPVQEDNCKVTQGTEESFSLKNSFWTLDTWSYGMDGLILTKPHRTKSVVGQEAGLMLLWETNSTWPKAEEPFIATNGSLFMSRKQWVKLNLNDYVHNMMFTFQGEHLNTPQVFQHDHSWTLVETSEHSFDRSFKIHIDFEHYKHFDYNLQLCSPRSNVTHYINYTKISDLEHEIRANASIHSHQPKFKLSYFEATDINAVNFATHIDLMSTLLNYDLNLRKQTDANGLTMSANISADGPLLGAGSRKTFSTSIWLQKNHSPHWDLTYWSDKHSGIAADISLIKQNQMKLILNLLRIDQDKIKYIPFITWTLELVEPQKLHHKLEFSSLTAASIQHKMAVVQNTVSHVMRSSGQTMAHNIKAELKNKLLPILNESLDGFFKRQKIGTMAVDVLNELWLDLPLVQALKSSHIDELLATSVQYSTQFLSHWIVHPPFFINQFIKVHMYQNFLEALADKTLTFSQHLFVNMPTFMQWPKLPVFEKKLLAYIKYKTLGSQLKDKDVAVIIDGRRIKTFDGIIYDITEPPAQFCSYLICSDLKKGHFALTYAKAGLTLSLQKFGLTLAQDGSIISFGSKKIDYLPYYSNDAHLILSIHDGEFHIDIGSGLVHLIFNPVKSFYILAIDRTLNNATIGLLGTNNHEKGDDFLLINGTVIENSIDFQNNYELSKSDECHISEPPSSISCMPSNDQTCSVFSYPDLQVCNTILSSQPFKLQCQVDVCQKQSECRSIAAYVAACRSRGIYIHLPPHCECGNKLEGQEIVVVQSLHQKLIKSNDPLLSVKHLLSSFEHDASIGLVTYGESGLWAEPKAHLLDGKLLVKNTKALHNLPSAVSPGQNETSAEDAVKVAASYPFQSLNSKMIILIYHHVTGQKRIKETLLKTLQRKGIILVAVSTYSTLEDKQIVGLLTDGKTIGTSASVTLPQDLFTTAVQESKGMWISLDTLIAGQPNNIRKIVYELTKLRSDSHNCTLSNDSHS
ncbi:apolipoprotein B-100 [Biomphalaria glabrata]|nr:apolipoprotein B-100-like [Biomphalaria glabrata]